MHCNPIRAYRDSKKLTLEAFGAAVGVNKAAVYKWEKGIQPAPESALRIEQATAGEIPRWKLRPDLWPAPDEGVAA